jgi:hypothetical protein
MAERAAYLVDEVLPRVPVRQWVRTLPYRLRYRLAWDHALCRAVLGVYARAPRLLRAHGPLTRHPRRPDRDGHGDTALRQRPPTQCPLPHAGARRRLQRSFLKHANRDPDAVLTFNPDWTDFSRYEAIWMHMTLALERFARPNSYLSYLDCGEVPKGVDLPVRPSPSHFRRPPRGHATTRSQTKFAIALEGSRCSDRGDRNDRNTQAALRRVEKTLLSRALRRVAIGSQSRSVRPSCSSSAS